MLYNLGCFYARRGDRGLALDHLERAMEVGMRNRDWFMTDPDLDSVREDPRFKALLE
jgi:adenylate cyclase